MLYFLLLVTLATICIDSNCELENRIVVFIKPGDIIIEGDKWLRIVDIEYDLKLVKNYNVSINITNIMREGQWRCPGSSGCSSAGQCINEKQQIKIDFDGTITDDSYACLTDHKDRSCPLEWLGINSCKTIFNATGISNTFLVDYYDISNIVFKTNGSTINYFETSKHRSGVLYLGKIVENYYEYFPAILMNEKWKINWFDINMIAFDYKLKKILYVSNNKKCVADTKGCENISIKHFESNNCTNCTIKYEIMDIPCIYKNTYIYCSEGTISMASCQNIMVNDTEFCKEERIYNEDFKRQDNRQHNFHLKIIVVLLALLIFTASILLTIICSCFFVLVLLVAPKILKIVTKLLICFA